jgi:hypothetical protein
VASAGISAPQAAVTGSTGSDGQHHHRRTAAISHQHAVLCVAGDDGSVANAAADVTTVHGVFLSKLVKTVYLYSTLAVNRCEKWFFKKGFGDSPHSAPHTTILAKNDTSCRWFVLGMVKTPHQGGRTKSNVLGRVQNGAFAQTGHSRSDALLK